MIRKYGTYACLCLCGVVEGCASSPAPPITISPQPAFVSSAHHPVHGYSRGTAFPRRVGG